MPTFLQLARSVASEGGTLSDGALSSVVGQTGRLGKVVGWVQAAWLDIQNRHSAWRWMQAEWQGDTVAGTQRYSAADLSVPRFAAWVTDEYDAYPVLSAYPQAGTVADARYLRFEPWDRFRSVFLRGAQEQGAPTHYSIDPADQIVLHPVPDAVYVLRGVYRKSPQALVADGDVPEAPERHHPAIVSAALVYHGVHDEAAGQLQVWQRRALIHMDYLERDQLPPVGLQRGGFA